MPCLHALQYQESQGSELVNFEPGHVRVAAAAAKAALLDKPDGDMDAEMELASCEHSSEPLEEVHVPFSLLMYTLSVIPSYILIDSCTADTVSAHCKLQLGWSFMCCGSWGCFCTSASPAVGAERHFTSVCIVCKH